MWRCSRVVTDRRSAFQGRCVRIAAAADVPAMVQEFLKDHKHIRKTASHPHILAWRVKSAAGVAEGFDDNGERGAGRRLLEVMAQKNAHNTLVIVTRWYGGTPLGSARFRHIAQCAYECLGGD